MYLPSDIPHRHQLPLLAEKHYVFTGDAHYLLHYSNPIYVWIINHLCYQGEQYVLTRNVYIIVLLAKISV